MDDIERWRGRIESSVDSNARRISEIFVLMESHKERNSIVYDKLKDKVDELEKTFAYFGGKITIIVAICTVIGTAVTTGLINIIARVFIK
jgi:hypothetical protein